MPVVLEAIKSFASECKGSVDMIKFVQDIEDLGAKIIIIDE